MYESQFSNITHNHPRQFLDKQNFMQSKQQNYHQQFQEEQGNIEENILQQLAQDVQLTKEQLINITNHQHFLHSKVQQFIAQAKTFIQTNKIEYALIYLNQAQKILEYAASSGKNIQRRIIISVLHNQACCYQALWQLQKCSSYIQALIFNFNSELKFTADLQSKLNHSRGHSHNYGRSQSHFMSSKKDLQTSSETSLMRLQCVRMEKKVELAKYYLLYCAINSQLKNNQCALIAAKKASELINKVFSELSELYYLQEKQSSQDQKLPLFVQTMLKEIPRIGTITPIASTQKIIDDLLCLVRYYIKVYNSRCVLSNLSSSKGSKGHSKEVYERYRNFSIGNIMQLQPVGETGYNHSNQNQHQMHEYHDNLQSSSTRISYSKLIEKLIIFSICQFTIATQLRYIALRNAQQDKELSYQLSEFKQSQFYHLMSILLIAMYMPFDILYMENLISSYHSHYQCGLFGEGFHRMSGVNEDEITKIKDAVVFTQNMQQLTHLSLRAKQEGTKKCSTTNHSNSSLIGSLNEEDQHTKHSSSTNKDYLKNCQEKKIVIDVDRLQIKEFQHENKLFAEYYYCKKNTQPGQKVIIIHEDDKQQKSHMVKQMKNKKKESTTTTRTVKCKKVTSKNKVDSKTKSKTKQSPYFQGKLSTVIIHPDIQKETISYKAKSHYITPQMTQSPILISETNSRIANNKSNLKNSKSKEIKKRMDFNKIIKHQQSQYFTKPSSISKKPNYINKNKSPFNKQINNVIKRKQALQIERQYFNIQHPYTLWKSKSPQTKTIYVNKKQPRKSVSRQKKQRLSSRSLKKSISSNGGLSIKCQISPKNSKLISETSKQKMNMRKQQEVSPTISPAMHSSRGSVCQKKSQRLTISNIKNQYHSHMERRN